MSNVISLSEYRNNAAETIARAKEQAAQVAPSLPAIGSDLEASPSLVGIFNGKELFDYNFLMKVMSLGLVRLVLQEVSKNGLPGGSSLLIAFDTTHPSVELSAYLKEKYPESMTILLDQWWRDLEVGRDSFSVTLNFQDIQETMVIPFDAISVFYDQGASFGINIAQAAHDPEPTPPVAA